MAFLAALAPYAGYIAAGASAAGALYQGAKQSQADQYNSQVMKNQQRVAIEQATAQEGMVRRNSREALGKQAAAFSGAGVGYGGSSETALDQSAINQELDALNTRYKGSVVGYGYGVESGILRDQSKQDMTASILLAGAQAFKNKNYTYMPKTPGQQ